MKVLVIVPAFNEEESLPFLMPKLLDTGWDCLVVNDCSTDGTANLLDSHHFNHIDLSNNIGIAGVTQMGFKYAAEHHYDAAIVIDGDGQHPLSYAKTLIAKIEEGYDYVVGSRFLNKKKPWTMRMVGSRMICGAIRMKTGKKVTDPTSGMRALGRKTIQEFANHMNFIAEPDAFAHVIHKKYRYVEVAVQMEEREAGISYFRNPLKSMQFMFDVLVSILVFQ